MRLHHLPHLLPPPPAHSPLHHQQFKLARPQRSRGRLQTQRQSSIKKLVPLLPQSLLVLYPYLPPQQKHTLVLSQALAVRSPVQQPLPLPRSLLHHQPQPASSLPPLQQFKQGTLQPSRGQQGMPPHFQSIRASAPSRQLPVAPALSPQPQQEHTPAPLPVRVALSPAQQPLPLPRSLLHHQPQPAR